MGNPQPDDPQGELPTLDSLHEDKIQVYEPEQENPQEDAPDVRAIAPVVIDPAVAEDAQRIAAQLEEPLLWLVANVIKELGLARADDLLQQTLEIEAAGGSMTATGDRRRTPGGVYLKLLKEQTEAEEQERIFADGPKTKPRKTQEERAKAANPPPIGPLPWDEARPEISRLVKLPLERASVKITLVGRPSQVSKTKSCVVVAMKGSRPPSLPKGLPPAPDGSDFSYVRVAYWEKPRLSSVVWRPNAESIAVLSRRY